MQAGAASGRQQAGQQLESGRPVLHARQRLGLEQSFVKLRGKQRLWKLSAKLFDESCNIIGERCGQTGLSFVEVDLLTKSIMIHLVRIRMLPVNTTVCSNLQKVRQLGLNQRSDRSKLTLRVLMRRSEPGFRNMPTVPARSRRNEHASAMKLRHKHEHVQNRTPFYFGPE